MPGCGKFRKSSGVICKDVVIIGNGPSAITLSYLLSGHVPFYRGNSDDEFLHLRLSENADEPLVLQDLQFLSDGLEGRSTNPVSVLFDALTHPDADLGVELPSLLDWKLRQDLAVDHVVLGKGAPGGAWRHMADSDLLTVSLGTWMELPNLPMKDWKPWLYDTVEGRINVSTVAAYYKDYVKRMSLGSNFVNNAEVTLVEQKTANCPRPQNMAQDKQDEEEELHAVFQQESLYNEQNEALAVRSNDDEDCEFSSCNGATSSLSSSALTSVSCDEGASSVIEEACNNDEDIIETNCLSATRIGQLMKMQARRRGNASCCLDLVSKCSCNSDEIKFDLSWNPIVFGCSPAMPDISGVACSFGSSFRNGRSYSWSTSRTRSTKSFRCPIVPRRCLNNPNVWEVKGHQTLATGEVVPFHYMANNVVLAIGSNDRPNFLNVPGEDRNYVVHTLQDMESMITSGELTDDDPIMIVGAGLSAADAIVAALNRGLSVIHVFRRSPDDRRVIFNNLPPAMYPEYHAIHRMMAKKESRPGYKPYSQHHVVRFEANKDVILHGTQSSSHIESFKVSLVVVLIGSSPNLDFFEDRGTGLGIVADEPISRNNLIDVDLFSHESVKHSGIYAMGPLVGDNFVRFLTGNALAIANHIHKKKENLT